ncbi:MAG: NAD(P)-dependent alcohol dehydrogenase [Acidimicrobiales bacterium]
MTTIHEPLTASRPTRLSADAQMSAITQDRYGSADVLSLDVIARPTPKSNEVLIEVVAAGIDRGTCHLMTGTPYLIRIAGYGLTKPKDRVPGLDLAGRVVAVGPDVTRFAPGDEVFGVGKGSLAEFTVADEDKLALKPAGVPFEQSAVAAVSGITALQALTDVGRAQPGQRVLIIGASGGVGSFAVQLAKALGTEVAAVAGRRNLDFLRTLGADHVVDYSAQDFTETDERYDLIIDIGGRNSVRRLRSVLTATGTLVIVGGEGGNRITGGVGRQLRAMLLSPFIQQRLTTFMSNGDAAVLDRLAGYLSDGTVTPAVRAKFGLADAPTALEHLAAGRASGKTAILVSQEGLDRVE